MSISVVTVSLYITINISKRTLTSLLAMSDPAHNIIIHFHTNNLRKNKNHLIYPS